METTSSTLSVFPSNKEQVEIFATKLKGELMGGVVNPLEVLRQQKAIEKVFDAIKPELTSLAREEAEKYASKSFQFMGSKIELAETGVKYDFSECGHNDYNALLVEIELLNARKKEIETMLKAIKEPINMIDSNGEPMTVCGPKKSSTSGLKVTL